jgi:spermidine synthase
MIRVFLLYALSGFVSLGYQVAWFRIFTDWFGSTNLTFALVVCNFIGGLGLGALLSERVTNGLGRRLGLEDRLRLYGLLEILVSVTALLTVLLAYIPADAWGSFPYSLSDGIWVQNGIYRFSQVMIAAACVFIPCLFMGMTFPLLCNVFVSAPAGDRFPAALYAWNTLGACTGVLACQFVLLPWIGHSMTFWAMAAVNLLLGGYFLVAGGAPAADAPSISVEPESKDESSVDRNVVIILLTCAALSGLLSGALEGDMFKRLSFAIQTVPGALMSFISFWAILAIFLASALVRFSTRIRLVHIKIAVIACVVSYAAGWYFMYPLLQALEKENFGSDLLLLAESLQLFPSGTFQLFYFVGIFVFVPYFLISLLLPYVCNRIQARRKHLGIAYGLNTLGFCIGMIGFTLIAPRVNIFYSLKLTMVFLACGAVLLLVISETKRLSAWKPGLAVAAFLAACVFVPSDFDPDYMLPGSPPSHFEVSALKSNGANTTFVLHQPGEKRLYFGNLSMSGTNGLSQTYMRLMAHFPLLAQARPRKALLICFGVGNTASAIMAHDTIEQLDVVDLNEKIFETAPEFSETHYDVHLDPRLRLIHDDGRNFLRITDERYDLITSEPPPPMAAGTYRLYSREYYEDILRHLTPGGMMTQWLPVYQMPKSAVGLAISTFVEVFPNTLLFVGYENELILVGGKAPIDLNLMRSRFFESERVVSDLNRIQIRDPIDLLVRVMRAGESLRAEFGGMGRISDERNDLEHLYLTPTQISMLAYDPVEVFEFVSGQVPELSDSLESVLTHLGRLRYRVARFPVFGVESNSAIALSDADWNQITLLIRDSQVKGREGDTTGAINALNEVLRLAPEQPDVLYVLADLYSQVGAYTEAAQTLRLFQRLEPEDPNGYILMGRAVLANRDVDEALVQFRTAIAYAPESLESLNNVAWILATHNDDAVRNPQAAIEFAERAAELSGNNNPGVLDTLAAAYASGGRFEEAISVQQRVITLAVDLNAGGLEAQAREHLRLYRRNEPVIDAG